MVCIWATSLELSWGIMALRMIVKNVKDWVYTHVKPEILRWIHDVRQDHLQRYSLTPSGDMAMHRRRAASCEPAKEAVDFEESVSPTSRSRYRTPRGRARPTLPHGETAPGSLNRRLAKFSVPEIQSNGLMESDEGGFDDSSDEGYASIHTRRWRGSEEDEEKRSSASICNDELSEDDSGASYVPPSQEDESTESESAEDGESDDDGASSIENLSRREENDDDYDLSDSERHCHQLNHQSRAFSRITLVQVPASTCTSVPKGRGHDMPQVIIPSTSPENTSPRHKNRAEEASNSQNKTNFVFGGRSTTRTPGLFGRANGGGGSIFDRPGPANTISTATGFRSGTYEPQTANKTVSQLSGAGTNVNREFGRNTSGSQTNNDHINDELSTFLKTRVDASHADGSSRTCSPSGPTTKPTFGSSFNTACSGFSIDSDSVASGTWSFTKASENTGLRSSGEETSLAAVIDAAVTKLATAFGSASLRDVFRDDVHIFGTTDTPFRVHIEEDTMGVEQHYQSVTFRSPYVDHSFKELNTADYDRGRRFCSPSDHSNRIHTLDGNSADKRNGAGSAFDANSTNTNRSVASGDFTKVTNGQIGASGQSSTFGGFGPSDNITSTSALGSNDTSYKGGLFGGGITINDTSRSRQSTEVLCAKPNSTSGHSFDPQPGTMGLFGGPSVTTISATSRGLFGGSNTINRGSSTSPFGEFGPGFSSVGTDDFKGGYGANLNTGSKSAPFGAGSTNIPNDLFGGGSMAAFGQSRNEAPALAVNSLKPPCQETVAHP